MNLADQIRSAICRLYLDLQIDSLLPDEFDKTCFVHWQKRALCISGPEVPESIGTWGTCPLPNFDRFIDPKYS